MHAILVSMGTAGDVYPFIGLGIHLLERGHKVTLVANERYRRFATFYGFQFVSFVSEQDTQELLSNADLWHPLKSASAGARWAGVRLEQQYKIVKAVAETPEAVLVAYAPVSAARMVHETTGVPLASVVPMPWMIPSSIEPPTLAGILNVLNKLPGPLRTLYWRFLESVADQLMGRDVNRLRKSLGLTKIRRVVRWAYSPQMTIAMFPDWYASAQADWPTNTHIVGFSMYDGMREDGLSDELLNFCRAGDPPVAFTFGTGMLHADQLFDKAVEVCQARQLRGILVTNHRPQIPKNLPATILPCSYAPFHQLLPHCAALVHHGGMGTTAQALAAAVPQLITPFAWDQYDNAARVKRLQAGKWCKPNRSSQHWGTLLDALLAPPVRADCRAVAARFTDHDANERAVEQIEQLGSG